MPFFLDQSGGYLFNNHLKNNWSPFFGRTSHWVTFYSPSHNVNWFICFFNNDRLNFSFICFKFSHIWVLLNYSFRSSGIGYKISRFTYLLYLRSTWQSGHKSSLWLWTHARFITWLRTIIRLGFNTYRLFHGIYVKSFPFIYLLLDVFHEILERFKKYNQPVVTTFSSPTPKAILNGRRPKWARCEQV